jgi:hypothetical protein
MGLVMITGCLVLAVLLGAPAAYASCTTETGFVGYLMFFGPLSAALALLVIVGRKAIRRITRRGA